MITLRTLEYEVESPIKVIETMKWHVILKSKTKTLLGMTTNDRPKILGHFQNGNVSFLLYPVLDTFLFAVHSMILAEGETKGESIIVRLRFSASGVMSIFGIMVLSIFLFNMPEEGDVGWLIRIGGMFGVLSTVYHWFRHLNKVEKIVDNLISMGSGE